MGTPAHSLCGRASAPRAQAQLAASSVLRLSPVPHHTSRVNQSTGSWEDAMRDTKLTKTKTAQRKIVSEASRHLALILCLLLLPPAISSAAPKKHRSEQTNTSKKKTSAKHQSSPSEETPAERDRRLFRECKGMPNAGACRGYTQR